MKNKGGGITINPQLSGRSPEYIFNLFIDMSNISVFTMGTVGIIFKLTLQDPAVFPYVGFDHDNFCRPIHTLIVKISLLEKGEGFFYQYKNIDKFLECVIPSEFEAEIDIQKEIVEKSIQYLNPLSPSIVFSKLNDIKSINTKLITHSDLTFFINKRNNRSRKIETLQITPTSVRVGVIAMESMENMNSVFNLLGIHRHFNPRYRDAEKHVPNKHMDIFNGDEQKQLYIANYIYKLIRLALLGYAHGDFHTANVLTYDNTANVLTYDNKISLIDFGRSIKLTAEQISKVKELFEIFIQIKTLNTLQLLVNFIFQLNDPIFEKKIGDDILLNPGAGVYETSVIEAARKRLDITVGETYGWFINSDVLKKVLSKILIIHESELRLKTSTLSKITSFITQLSSSTTYPTQIVINPSTDFLNTLIGNAEDINMFKNIADDERQILQLELADQEILAEAAEERQRLEAEAAEAERQRLEADIHNKIFTNYIQKPPLVSSINVEALHHIASQYKFSQYDLYKKLKELLIISTNDRTQEITDLIYTIRYLQEKHAQGMVLSGGAAPVLTTEYSFNQLTQQSKKDPNKNDKQIQAKIAEIKQIQSDMAKIFAEWRDTIYDIYTNPNDEERNAYYQEQTPFTILTHLMVCSGLFGPLKSGKYIDVKEEVNKELYDKLNSIAAAFVTMNNGYLSMSNVKIQLMIEDAKTSTATVTEEVKIEGPTVEVTQYSDPEKYLPENMIDRGEGIAGFGGNKKYSRRKRRRHSKRQKKYCRRKSNKRFYSKKNTKKRRNYF
jgi:hypothetical protein